MSNTNNSANLIRRALITLAAATNTFTKKDDGTELSREQRVAFFDAAEVQIGKSGLQSNLVLALEANDSPAAQYLLQKALDLDTEPVKAKIINSNAKGRKAQIVVLWSGKSYTKHVLKKGSQWVDKYGAVYA